MYGQVVEWVGPSPKKAVGGIIVFVTSGKPLVGCGAQACGIV